MLFYENKYSKWYFQIIDRAKKANRVKGPQCYFESHHIIPKCVGGTEEVLLTAKEHFICHLILVKMTSGQLRHKMINALIKMAFSKSKGQYRYTSRSFSLVRTFIAQKNREKFKGRIKSDQVRANMKGRSGTWIRTDQSRKNSRKGALKRFETSPGTMLGRKHTQETRQKYSLTRKGQRRGFKSYTDGTKNIYCIPGTQLPGYVLGRTGSTRGCKKICMRERIDLVKGGEKLGRQSGEPGSFEPKANPDE